MSSVTYLDKEQKIAYLDRSGAMVMASSYAPIPENGFTNYDTTSEHAKPVRSARVGTDDMPVAPWGGNNLRPNFLLQLLGESNINSALIYTKVSFAVGHVYAYKWEMDPETGMQKKVPFMPDDHIRRLMNSPRMRNIYRSRATDFYIHGSVWGMPLIERDGKEVKGWKHYDAFQCRLAIEDTETKEINFHYVSSDWKNPTFPKPGAKEKDPKVNVAQYPTFDPDNPFEYYQSLHHSKLYWSGQRYYGIQPWHSGYNWIFYANKMPVWMSANINRSFNIKYHIEYPETYFDYLKDQFDDPEQRKAEKEKVFKALDDLLSGADNAQTSVYTPYKIDSINNSEFAGWKIHPIKNDLKDDAFINAFEMSNHAMASAHGIDIELAGIAHQGKMPVAGSAKRISYQMHEVLKTQEARDIMLEPLMIMRDANSWDPDMHFDVMMRDIVTLDQDKTGITPDIPEI